MTCQVCGAELTEGTLFCGDCGSSVTASRVGAQQVADSRPADTSIVESFPQRNAPGAVPGSTGSLVDLPATQAISLIPGAEAQSVPDRPYTLSFSTGETVEVCGRGLIGRRPVTQPGERVDQLVIVSDPARSVSKTHLEFGLEGAELWICDRYSGNGTVAHPLGGASRLCEAGRRYRVTRGTRVDIGDQWFDVS